LIFDLREVAGGIISPQAVTETHCCVSWSYFMPTGRWVTLVLFAKDQVPEHAVTNWAGE
jgi:hypothetical protein